MSEKKTTSTMRVGMFMCLATAIYLAITGMHSDRSLYEVGALVAPFLVTGIGGKVWQKFAEVEE